MRVHLSIFLIGLVALALAGAPQAATVHAAPLLPEQIFLPLLQTPDTSHQDDLQRQNAEEVLRLVNVERASAGCPALSLNEDLGVAAQAHSVDMATNNYFSHTSLDGSDFVVRLRDAGFTGAPGGENIAAGYTTALAVMTGWMHSEGHRENILACEFRTLGVGYATSDSSEYASYWTQDFGQ